jgi:FIMAH domain
VQNLATSVSSLYTGGEITKAGTRASLLSKLAYAQTLLSMGNTIGAKNLLIAFINEVKAQIGKSITPDAAAQLIAEANAILAQL